MIRYVCCVHPSVSRRGITQTSGGKRRKTINRKNPSVCVCVCALQMFPHFQEFTVVHDYLVTPSRKMQARLRRRGQKGLCVYVSVHARSLICVCVCVCVRVQGRIQGP